MTKELEKVCIVDKEMENAMRRIPKYKEVKDELEKEDFKVVCFNDTQNKELFSGDKSQPIDDYQGMVIRSDLYVGDKSFYPMLDYAESYFTELNLVMEDMAGCMGATLWEFSYLEESFEIKKQSDSFNADIIVNVLNKGGGGVGYKQTNASGNSEETKFLYDTKKELIGRKKSPQEFEAYIKERNINIHAFDQSFKDQIQRYIKGENIGFTAHTVDKSKRITQYIKSCYNISLYAKVCKVFDTKFKINLESEESTECKYRAKLSYRMSFK